MIEVCGFNGTQPRPANHGLRVVESCEISCEAVEMLKFWPGRGCGLGLERCLAVGLWARRSGGTLVGPGFAGQRLGRTVAAGVLDRVVVGGV